MAYAENLEHPEITQVQTALHSIAQQHHAGEFAADEKEVADKEEIGSSPSHSAAQAAGHGHGFFTAARSQPSPEKATESAPTADCCVMQ